MNPNLSYEEIIKLVDAFDVRSYAKTRNHLEGTVSFLSPYVTHGVIDLPTIRNHVLQKYSPKEAEKFIQELAWREYFQKVWYAKKDAIFSDLRFPRTHWEHQELVTSIVEAQTGIESIDAELATLYQTGYMHNHARMWTAMLACNVAKAHWYNMGRFLYYHLLDGDLASNFLSWQWVSGTSASKEYVANQSLINGCSKEQQRDTYLSIPIEQIGIGVIPSVLTPYSPFTATTKYPESDVILNLKGEKVFLYHPWSIDPLWRKNEPGVRILVIEPKWFDRFPVSPKVLDFIISLAHTHIPHCKIFVGNVEMLTDLEHATEVYSKRYPATLHWPGTIDSSTELFPSVQGYFPSFFKFWQECLKKN